MWNPVSSEREQAIMTETPFSPSKEIAFASCIMASLRGRGGAGGRPGKDDGALLAAGHAERICAFLSAGGMPGERRHLHEMQIKRFPEKHFTGLREFEKGRREGMNWIGELYDLYDKNERFAGKMEPGQPVLLPLYHTQWRRSLP